MYTSKEMINKILEFYDRKPSIYAVKLEFVDTVNGKKIMLISYYRDQHTRPINRLDLTIAWNENDGVCVNSDENCIAMRNRLNQFGVFEPDELEFFDRLGMNICKEAENETEQHIEDWF